jgi:hypothetical protein
MEGKVSLRSARMSRSAAILIVIIGLLTLLINITAGIAIFLLGVILLVILRRLTNTMLD